MRPKLAASPSFRDQFDESMRGVAALSHPNIAAVYDWGIARVGDMSTAYVVNEHLAGGSLRDMFDRGRRLSPSQALAVGLDVCRALDHAHRRQFVHTELSPSKIVFGDDRRLRVIDFGLAQLLGAPTWEQPDSVPTHVAWYAAPEQALGEPVDGRADVYALGLSLHEAVTGSLPFKSDSTVAALSARVGRLMPVSADLGPLASVLERAGRPDPPTSGRPPPSSARACCRRPPSCRGPSRCRCCRRACSTRRPSSCAALTTRPAASCRPGDTAPPLGARADRRARRADARSRAVEPELSPTALVDDLDRRHPGRRRGR